MKRIFATAVLATLVASPAFAGGRTANTGGGLLNLGAINVSALNGIASGNRVVVAAPVTAPVGILNGSRTNVLSGVKGIVGGLLGGGHGCGCN